MVDLYSPDSMAFMDPMDSTFSSLFPESDPQMSYFDMPLSDNSDSYLVSPFDTFTDPSLDPSMLSAYGAGDVTLNNLNLDRDSISAFESSRTPSLCLESQPATPTLEAMASPEPERTEPPKRKRGRPRLNRLDSNSSHSTRKARINHRQPHNEVERKYREGLNSELERLRLAIPTLPQWDSQAINGPPKPSKATILATAIDYIYKIERERDQLKAENELLQIGRRRIDVGY